MSPTLTVQKIDNAMKGADFWLTPDGESAQIVTEAARLGYVKRLSHTQVQWTEAGLAKARAELEPAQAPTFDTRTTNTHGATVVVTSDPNYGKGTTLADAIAADDARVWTTLDVSALCRGLGMREFKSLTEFAGAVHNGARYGTLWPSTRVGSVFFYDYERALTVILLGGLFLCVTGPFKSNVFKPAQAAEWLLSKFEPAPVRPSVFKGHDDEGLAVYSVDSRVIGR